MVYEELLKSLNKHRVDYVVAGGVAMILYGVMRMTADIDFIVNLEQKNISRFLDVMNELGYRPRVPVSEQEILSPSDRQRWIREKNMKALSFYNPASPVLLVAVLIYQPIDYGQLKKRSVTVRSKGLGIPLTSIGDMIALKRESGRPQDKADIEALEEVKKRKQHEA